LTASMEPLFFKAENSVCARYTGASTCFNGAAFFQSGKSSEIRPNLRTGVTRLQWSRFFSKRKMSVASSWTDFFRALQWSRFFSKRKMRLTAALPASPL